MPKNIRVDELNLTGDFSTRRGFVYRSSFSLIGWYKFEDQAIINANETLAYDYATNDNHGVYTDNVEFIRFPNFRAEGGPVSSGGLRLVKEGCVTLPTVSTFNIIKSSFSIAFWYRAPKDAVGNQLIFSIDSEEDDRVRLQFVYDPANQEINVRIEDPVSLEIQLTSFRIPANYHPKERPPDTHIVYTYNAVSQEHAVYANEVAIPRTLDPDSPYIQEFLLEGRDTITIGNDKDLSRPASGDIGSVALWSSCLLETEAIALYYGYIGDKGISGFMNPPVRVIQHKDDCSPLSYPSVTRAGPGGITGNESSRPYDDTKTIVFDSSYATAWIYFFARPREASVITLFDPAGGIDLLPAVASIDTAVDDMTVESNNALHIEQTYEVKIVESSTYGTLTEDGTGGDIPEHDWPVISGQWTGMSSFRDSEGSLALPENPEIQIKITELGHPGDIEIEGKYDTDKDAYPGEFSVSLKLDGEDDNDVVNLAAIMPLTLEEEFLADCIVPDAMTDTIADKLAGIKILWPNPYNTDNGTEDEDGVVNYSPLAEVEGNTWIIQLPAPDKFAWRKANLEDYAYKNNWTEWYPSDEGTYIGTGNVRRSYVVENTRYSNVEDDDYIYSDPIDLSIIDPINGVIPSSFTARIYARGDISSDTSFDSEADDEYYEVEWSTTTPEDGSAYPTEWTSFGDPIVSLQSSQKSEGSDGTGSGSYEYHEEGRFNGPMAHAPFADGRKFTEAELEFVPKDSYGRPKYDAMPDDPHITTDPASPATITGSTLYIRVKPGPAVSWGKCQVKVECTFDGLFWYFDDIDNDDASGNNIRLKWETFTGHTVGDQWTVVVEDTTKETFEFNRGVITNPTNTEVKIRRMKKRDLINGAFAKAVNGSGLQVVAHHDGDRVLLQQTVPGNVGNLEIHADKLANCYISNSKKFIPGSKGEVTGSFSGGDEYLVSYPTTLPAPVQKSTDGVLYWSNRDSNDFSLPEGMPLDDSPAYQVISANDINILLSPDNKKLYVDNNGAVTTSYDEISWNPYPLCPDPYDSDVPCSSTAFDSDNYSITYYDTDGAEVALDSDDFAGTATSYEITRTSDGWTEDVAMANNGFTPMASNSSWSEEAWREEFGFTYRAFVESPWLNHRIMTPNFQNDDYERGLLDVGLITTGSTKKGVADIGLSFSEDQSTFSKGPFNDDQIDIDVENEFFEEGISSDVYEGFSSPLKSKTQITINLNTVEPTEVGFDREDSTGDPQKYNAMVYYNFANKSWENVGPGFYVRESNLAGKGPEFQEKFFESACIGFSRGVELIQSGTVAATLPISNFGFPMHPKFHASDEQQLSLKNFINKPFILEKFVLEYEAEWTEGTDYVSRTVMYDVDGNGKITRVDDDGNSNNKAAINSFFILNQRDWIGTYEYNTPALPERMWYPPLLNKNIIQDNSNEALNRYIWNKSGYDYRLANSLTSWFRFDETSFNDAGYDSFIAGVINSDGTTSRPELTIGPDADAVCDMVEESPWEFPPGAPTSFQVVDIDEGEYSVGDISDYDWSVSIAPDRGDGVTPSYLYSTLGGLVGNVTLADEMSTSFDEPSSEGNATMWYWNADVSDDAPDANPDWVVADGDNLVWRQDLGSARPGTWTVGYAFSNDPDETNPENAPQNEYLRIYWDYDPDIYIATDGALPDLVVPDDGGFAYDDPDWPILTAGDEFTIQESDPKDATPRELRILVSDGEDLVCSEAEDPEVEPGCSFGPFNLYEFHEATEEESATVKIIMAAVALPSGEAFDPANPGDSTHKVDIFNQYDPARMIYGAIKFASGQQVEYSDIFGGEEADAPIDVNAGGFPAGQLETNFFTHGNITAEEIQAITMPSGNAISIVLCNTKTHDDEDSAKISGLTIDDASKWGTSNFISHEPEEGLYTDQWDDTNNCASFSGAYWDYPEEGWRPEDYTKNARIYYGNPFSGVSTIRYKLIQGKASQYLTADGEHMLGEPPDVGMEGKEFQGRTYADEGIELQIASAVDSGGSLVYPDSISKDDWHTVKYHRPNYSKQGVWSDHSITIDPEVYGVPIHDDSDTDTEDQRKWFVRFLQPGTSGWADSWMVTDINVGTFSSFSSSLWFKSTKPGAPHSNILTIADQNSTPNKIWLSIYSDGHLRFSVDSGQNRVYTKAKSSNPVTDGLWHHIVISFSSESYLFGLWLDGELMGEFTMPQSVDEDGHTLWRKGDASVADEAVTLSTADISYYDVLDTGIYIPTLSSDGTLVTSKYGTWDSGNFNFTGATTEEQAQADSYTFAGTETINIGGLDVTMTQDEFMVALGYNASYPWYFESTDFVVLGADVDSPDDGDGDSEPTATFDNAFTGNISDFATWSTSLTGIDAKAIYHMRSGYYKVGRSNDAALVGTNPYFFDCPIEKNFIIRDDQGLYLISENLLSRYLVDPNDYNNLLVSGKVTSPACIQGGPLWCDDGPWQPDTNVSRVPNKYRYGIDFNRRFFVTLPRANEYFPEATETYPEFSFFTWIKVDGEVESTNPVIFSINTKSGGNRLIFMIDTADTARRKGSKAKGYRLQLYVDADTKSLSEDDIGLRDSADGELHVSTGDDATTDLSPSRVYRIMTDHIRDFQGAATSENHTEINDNTWHHVGLTYNADDAFGYWNIWVNGVKQQCHVVTYIKAPGPSNDIWRYVFDGGQDGDAGNSDTASTDAGYYDTIWGTTWESDATTGTWNSADVESGEAREARWNRFQRCHGWAYQEPPTTDETTLGLVYSSLGYYSDIHKPLSFNELDRVSIGQEYDTSWTRKFNTTRAGVRTYRHVRYRKPSQFFEGKMADISIWDKMLIESEIEQLYSSVLGSSEGDKWFNRSGSEARKNTARDLVTFGQWSIYGSVDQSSSDINDILTAGLSRETDTEATYRQEILDDDGLSLDPPQYEFISYDGDPKTTIHVSGSYKMDGLIKRPIKHKEGLAYRVGNRYGSTRYRSYYKTSHNGTRTGQENDIASARAIFNAVPGKDTVESYFDFGQERRGFDTSPLSLFENNNQESPYILMPNDNLVFGWQCATPYDFYRVVDSGTGPHMTLGPNASITNPSRMKITLFGSYIQDGKEKQDDLNQNLTSDSIHEALQFETPIYDKFQLEDIGYNAGAYTDDVVSGSMEINEVYGKKTFQSPGERNSYFGSSIARRKIASVAEHTQGSKGSMLRGVKVVDSRERFYDTVVASPADYHSFNGNGILEWSSPLFQNGKKQKSIVFGEPRPSDQKIVQAEKTYIRCQGDGWHDPAPQGVIKLTFGRLWTADDEEGNSSITATLPYYCLTNDAGTSFDCATTAAETINKDQSAYQLTFTYNDHHVPWKIESESGLEEDYILYYKYQTNEFPFASHNPPTAVKDADTDTDTDPFGATLVSEVEAGAYGQYCTSRTNTVPYTSEDDGVTEIPNYTAYSAGKNYMFGAAAKSLDDAASASAALTTSYLSIYDANSDLHVIHLDWGDRVEIPTISNNIISVDLSGWDEALRTEGPWSPSESLNNIWESGDSLAEQYNLNLDNAGDGGSEDTDTISLLLKDIKGRIHYGAPWNIVDDVTLYDDDGVAEGVYSINDFSQYADWPADAAEDGLLNSIGSLLPKNTAMVTAKNFADKVAMAIDASPLFEVLVNHNSEEEFEDGSTTYAFRDEKYSLENATAATSGFETYSIYVRTIQGGLAAADPSGTNTSDGETPEGGGLPGIHYSAPDVDSNELSKSYQEYNELNGAPIVDCKYSYLDLRYEGILVKNGWGLTENISTDYITFSPDNDYATCRVSETSADDIIEGYAVNDIAGSLGLPYEARGVSDFIQTLRPNNPDQFKRQLPIYEEKNNFERISGYTIDGCFMEIHDAKDNAYNIWYKLDDGDAVFPNPPSTSGILITVDSLLPGSPASTVAYETMLAVSSSYSDKFIVEYNDGDEFFSIENTEDGSTKDADSSTMGLPTTTGFYLTDEAGEEYDNETWNWQTVGSVGGYSFSITTEDNESYAQGKTPESPEYYWQGDPLQEGVDPYHLNTNSTIDSLWLASYPFEPRYASLKRGSWKRDNKSWNVTTWDDEDNTFTETSRTESEFLSVIITGSNMPSVINDPTLDDDNSSQYFVLTLIGDGSPVTRSTSILASPKTNNNFIKFYFGCGDRWQKNPEVEIVNLYSDGYDWPSAVPKIRGWKYGLKSALPENSSAVYNHTKFGQFRDMMEQRRDSRFYRTLTKGRWAGRQWPSASPVRVLFVDEDGQLTPPEKTWSQNLSRFCTSSLPYFDDGIPRNREHPINESGLNTSYGVIED